MCFRSTLFSKWNDIIIICVCSIQNLNIHKNKYMFLLSSYTCVLSNILYSALYKMNRFTREQPNICFYCLRIRVCCLIFHIRHYTRWIYLHESKQIYVSIVFVYVCAVKYSIFGIIQDEYIYTRANKYMFLLSSYTCVLSNIPYSALYKMNIFT